MADDEAPAELVDGSVVVTFDFVEIEPMFGDLFLITGEAHPRFRPVAGAPYQRLASLGFQQADDYFAIFDDAGEPAIWLYPQVDRRSVDHHPGPFSGIQIESNLLAHPVPQVDVLVSALEAIVRELGVSAYWGDAREPMHNATLGSAVAARLQAAIAHWHDKGITPGSEAAVLLSCS